MIISWDELSGASEHDKPLSSSTCSNNTIEMIFISANIHYGTHNEVIILSRHRTAQYVQLIHAHIFRGV